VVSPLLDALLSLLPLDALPRTGWIQAGVAQPESIAAHGLGTALVALALGPRVEPALDVDRAVALCVVHDAPEALSGDLPRAVSETLPPGTKRALEEQLAERILLPLSETCAERFAEYAAGESREARFARACDRLHLGLRWLGYRRAGARGLEGFRATLEASDVSEFGPCAALLTELLAAEERLA
jgi:putative hydrolase of HD superfamily